MNETYDIFRNLERHAIENLFDITPFVRCVRLALPASLQAGENPLLLLSTVTGRDTDRGAKQLYCSTE